MDCEFGGANYHRKVVKTKLANYIRANNKEKLETLLANDSNLKLIKNERYFNPFVIAIRANNLGVFDFLLEKGLALDEEEETTASQQEQQQSGIKRNSSKKTRRKRNGKKRKLDSNSSQSSTSSTSSYSESDEIGSRTYSNTLIEAIKCVNLEAVDLLIRLKVNVNSTNYKYIPLQIAYNVYSNERDRYLSGNCEDLNKFEVSWGYKID